MSDASLPQALMERMPAARYPLWRRAVFLVRSLVFTFWLWMLMLMLGLWIPLLKRLDEAHRWHWGQQWVRAVMAGLRWFCGLDYEVRGREHLVKGAAVYASKHQSAWETLVFMPLVGRPAYVLKKQLLRIPFFGTYLMLLGMVPINREKGAEAVQVMLEAARRICAQGRPVVLFPEGTRRAVGAPPHYRRRGLTTLYRELNVPVVPVALNSGVYWGRNQLIKYPGRIVIELLPPVPPGLPEEEMRLHVEQAIESASRRLVEEALTKEI